MSGRVLVAGVGNIFLGDDGFGVEVARRLAGERLPEDVRVADFGIRGVHLAYELLDGYDTAILVDAAPRGGQPGTLYVIEPEPELVALLSESELIAMVNWTMLSQLTDVFRNLLTRILPKLSGPRWPPRASRARLSRPCVAFPFGPSLASVNVPSGVNRSANA